MVVFRPFVDQKHCQFDFLAFFRGTEILPSVCLEDLLQPLPLVLLVCLLRHQFLDHGAEVACGVRELLADLAPLLSV